MYNYTKTICSTSVSNVRQTGVAEGRRKCQMMLTISHNTEKHGVIVKPLFSTSYIIILSHDIKQILTNLPIGSSRHQTIHSVPQLYKHKNLDLAIFAITIPVILLVNFIINIVT